MSELADCYIYDFVKGNREGTAAGYLFAGSNVDTSKNRLKTTTILTNHNYGTVKR